MESFNFLCDTKYTWNHLFLKLNNCKERWMFLLRIITLCLNVILFNLIETLSIITLKLIPRYCRWNKKRLMLVQSDELRTMGMVKGHLCV